MAVLSMRQLPNTILRQKAKRVRIIDDSVQRLIDDMVETMHYYAGLGLAAPQVGVSRQVMVIQMPGEELIVLINPEVVKRSGEYIVEEGCLSVPGYRGEIKRSLAVTVKGRNRQGKNIRLKAEGLLAQALQHEIDHLNGMLYIDHLESQDRLHRIEPAPEEMG